MEFRRVLFRSSFVFFRLLFQGLTLYLKTHYLAMRFLKRRRFVLNRETQGGRRLVYQVYGFVRKEALGDVADGKLNRRYYRIIRDAHAVKELVALDRKST